MGQNPVAPKALKGEVVPAQGKKNKGSGKGKKLGRNKRKCLVYRTNKEREKHKIIKIARSNGVKAAMKYAEAKGVMPYAILRLKHFKTKVNTHDRSPVG